MNDPHLDRSYEYDQVGRLAITHTGAEARAHAYSGQWGTMDGPYSLGFDYDVWGNMTHRYGWGGEVQGGSAGQSSDLYYAYSSSNQRTGFTFDLAGNLTYDGGQNFEYDATGQQTKAYYTGYTLNQGYDGNGLRVSKSENNAPPTYYLRSSVLGGQVVAEINWFSVSWAWNRGYVYSGAGLLAVQYGNAVSWVHEDPVTKSKRITNSSGVVISSVELDPWGADAGSAWSSNAAFQPRKFTTYDRDGNGSDEAMFRRHNRWHSRFDQPDPYDGSYRLGNPQSFNRYAYVQNDPVNFLDPRGLDPDVIVTDTWAPHWTDGLAGTIGASMANDTGIKIVDPTEGSGGGGGGEPGEPHSQPPTDPGQPLSQCVKNRLRPYFPGVNLDDIRVFEGIPNYVVGDPLAYTEGNRIYFKEGRYDPYSVAGLSDIGHEVTHSQQYAKLGTKEFQTQYISQYLTLRRLGLDHQTAYENISFEVEARKRGDIIQKDLTNLMRDFGGRDPCPR